MEICNLCAEYGTHCDGNSLDFGKMASCTGYKPKGNNTPPKERKVLNPNKDIEGNKSVKREPFDIWEEPKIPSYIRNSPTKVLLQGIINKIERKLNYCENFIDNNKESLKLSQYVKGYYNGRTKAFEGILDLIKDTLAKAYNEELEDNQY